MPAQVTDQLVDVVSLLPLQGKRDVHVMAVTLYFIKLANTELAPAAVNTRLALRTSKLVT